VGEGEEVGEISIIVLVGVVGADILILRTKVGMLRLLRVGVAMVGRWSIFKRRETALIDGWDCENFWTSSSMFMSSLLTHESCTGE